MTHQTINGGFVIKTIALTALLLGATVHAQSSDPATCPLHAEHMKAASEGTTTSHEDHVVASGDAKHGAAVDSRHDSLVMSHEVTSHSFRLFADGGAIELRANDSKDSATVASVRTHLHGIASEFTNKDFKTPTFVHGYTPDGVKQMERLHASINYRYEDVDSGARIRMTTHNPEALSAIHDFLRFQVIEHRTANSSKVEKDK
jgi:hypothetical protein